MTGTHGITAMDTMVTAAAGGEGLRINQDDELYNAVVMGMGMLGVITEVTVQVWMYSS